MVLIIPKANVRLFHVLLLEQMNNLLIVRFEKLYKLNWCNYYASWHSI